MTAFLNQCSQKCHISLCSDLSRREVPAVTSLAASHKFSWCHLCPQPVKKGQSSNRETSPCSPSPETIAALQGPREAGLCKNVTKPKAMSHSLRSKCCLCPFSFAKLSVTGYKWSAGLIPLLLSMHWMPCTAPVFFFFFWPVWRANQQRVTYLFLIAGMLRGTCRHLFKKGNNFIVHTREEGNHPFQCTWWIYFPFIFFLNLLKENSGTELHSCAWEVRNKASGNLCCWHSVTVQWGMLYHLSHASSLEVLWKI